MFKSHLMLRLCHGSKMPPGYIFHGEIYFYTVSGLRSQSDKTNVEKRTRNDAPKYLY